MCQIKSFQLPDYGLLSFLQVCQSAEDYRGYDRELGLCVCRAPPGRAACGGLCRIKLEGGLQVQCNSDGDVELKWSREVSQKTQNVSEVMEAVICIMY